MDPLRKDAPAISFCSFSGGKDSCLALWKAREQGFDVRTLLVMMNESGESSRSHGIPRHLLQQQAAALGKELVMGAASWQSYEQEFVELLKKLRAQGHEAGIFGDIDLLPHREWEEKVCAAAGLRAHLPLWQRNRDELAREISALGFKAVVVCVDSRHLDDSFAGRLYDANFLDDLPKGVDACGENGEFHTFVFDGPVFPSRSNGASSVAIRTSRRWATCATASRGSSETDRGSP